MKSTHNSPLVRWFTPAAWSAVALLCLSVSARASNVTVDCTGATPGAFTSITAAVNALDNIGPHTVTVTGPCSDNVSIFRRDRLTIEAFVGQTATVNAANPAGNVFTISGSNNITLRRLVVRGGATGIVISRGSVVQLQGLHIKENTGPGLRADLDSVVSLGGSLADQFVTVSDNAGAGIASDASVLLIAGLTTVENNAGSALNIVGGRAIFNGVQAENLFRGNGFGINLTGTIANFIGQNTIQNNGQSGVQVGSGSADFSTAMVGDALRVNTIEGHTLGVNVAAAGSASFGGPNRIRGNGLGNQDAIFRGGVRIGTVSRVQFTGGTEITDNTGFGVLLDFNGALALNGAVVANNTLGGVRVTRSSVAGFGEGNSFAGNGGSRISCDTTSLIHGPGLVGFGKIDCKNIE
ncbi:MAG TPA: hypothetical protein VFH31_20055 [Pyrinomonadaceae bacterium]|nr:hypothetical protein [Pyrinomonadaceae bacterium]